MASRRRGGGQSLPAAKRREITARIALMEKEPDEKMRELADVPPEERVRAAEELIEELEQELEQASAQAPVDSDEE